MKQVRGQTDVKLHLIKSSPPTLYPLSVSVTGTDPETLLKGTPGDNQRELSTLQEGAQYLVGQG